MLGATVRWQGWRVSSAGYYSFKLRSVIGVSLIPSSAQVLSLLCQGKQSSPGDGDRKGHGHQVQQPRICMVTMQSTVERSMPFPHTPLCQDATATQWVRFCPEHLCPGKPKQLSETFVPRKLLPPPNWYSALVAE